MEEFLPICSQGNKAEIRQFLRKNPSVLAYVNEVSYHKYYSALKVMISMGADIQKNCLPQVAANGDLDMVIYLVNLGADIHERFCEPLRYACLYGRMNVVRYLVQKGSIPDEICVYNAVKSNNISIVKYIISKKMLILDSLNRLAQWACFERRFEAVEYLCSIGADFPENCHKLYTKYIQICNRSRERAQKKIYFWWIPICYDTTRECGKRMRQKNWETYTQLDFF